MSFRKSFISFWLFLWIGLGVSAQVPAPVLEHVIVLQCAGQVRLLDLFEGESLRAYHELKLQGQNEADYFENLMKQLEVRMPDRVQLYRAQAPVLLKQVEMRSQPGGLGVPDSTELIIRPPNQCRFLNLAVAQSDGKILIDQGLWTQLSIQDQAASVLHLLLSKEVRVSGQNPKSSIYLRALNSALFSVEFSGLGLANMIQIFQSAQLFSLRIQSVLVDLSRPLTMGSAGYLESAMPVKGGFWSYSGKSVELKSESLVNFHKNGVVKSLRFKGKLVVPYLNNQVPFVTPDQFSRVPFDQEANPVLSFYDTGTVDHGLVTDPVNLATDRFKVRLSTEKSPDEVALNSHLYFFETGEVKLVTHAAGSVFWKGQWIRLAKNASVDLFSPQQLKELVVDQSVMLTVQNQPVPFNGYLSFYENGWIDCAYPTINTHFLNSQKKPVTVEADTQACFDAQGWIIGN